LFVSVNNVFDKYYEEVRDYNTPGRHFNLGATITF